MEVNQQISNQNENESVGVGARDTTKIPLVRKRSSLKPRCSMKEGGIKPITNKLGLKRQITFNEDVIENEKKSEKSYSNSKTRFSSVVRIQNFIKKINNQEGKDDLYIQKLNEINKIETTVKIFNKIHKNFRKRLLMK